MMIQKNIDLTAQSVADALTYVDAAISMAEDQLETLRERQADGYLTDDEVLSEKDSRITVLQNARSYLSMAGAELAGI